MAVRTTDAAIALISYVQYLLEKEEYQPEPLLLRRLIGKLTLDEISAMVADPAPPRECCRGCGQTLPVPAPPAAVGSATVPTEPLNPFRVFEDDDPKV